MERQEKQFCYLAGAFAILAIAALVIALSNVSAQPVAVSAQPQSRPVSSPGPEGATSLQTVNILPEKAPHKSSALSVFIHED